MFLRNESLARRWQTVDQDDHTGTFDVLTEMEANYSRRYGHPQAAPEHEKELAKELRSQLTAAWMLHTRKESSATQRTRQEEKAAAGMRLP